jgi:hypothetical protein
MLAAPPLSADDLAALRRAKHEIESQALTMKLASIVGSPMEKLISRMPAIASDKVNDATQLALRKCLQIALRTLGRPMAGAPLGVSDRPSNLLH